MLATLSHQQLSRRDDGVSRIAGWIEACKDISAKQNSAGSPELAKRVFVNINRSAPRDRLHTPWLQ